MTQIGKLAASWPNALLIVVVTVTMLMALNGCKSSGTRGEAEPPVVAQEPTLPSLPAEEPAGSVVKIITSQGDILIELFDKQAPITAGNFLLLVEDGFYDGVVFHRIIPDFMAQGGDPTGTGTGGPGYRFEDEIDPGLVFDAPGILAMANAGPNTNGSQFFITLVPTPWLNTRHTIFGRITEGMDVLQSLSLRDPQSATAPGDLLKTIEIIEED